MAPASLATRLLALLAVQLLAFVVSGTAAPAGLAKRCREQCAPLVPDCVASTGKRARVCKRTLLRQCKRQGLQVCTPPSTTTSTTRPTLLTTSTSVGTVGTTSTTLPLDLCGNSNVDPGEQCEDTLYDPATCPACVGCECKFFARPNFDAGWELESHYVSNACHLAWPQPWDTFAFIVQNGSYLVASLDWPSPLGGLAIVPIEGWVNADYPTRPGADLSSGELRPAAGSPLFDQFVDWLDLDPASPASRALRFEITVTIDGTGTNTTATGPILSSNLATVRLSIRGGRLCELEWRGVLVD